MPYRHELSTRLLVAGRKLEIVPMLEPPRIAEDSTIIPRSVHSGFTLPVPSDFIVSNPEDQLFVDYLIVRSSKSSFSSFQNSVSTPTA